MAGKPEIPVRDCILTDLPSTGRQKQNVGSGWDTNANSPDGILARHRKEWLESGNHPALIEANLLSLAGAEVLQLLAGDRLEQLGGWSQQLATASVQSLLGPLEPIAEAGGWWCSGLDPLADWAPMAWGCFKPNQPRWDEERRRQRKYEHPIKVAARSFWLRVPPAIAKQVARRWELTPPAEVLADHGGSGGAFWRWWATEARLPLLITEGAKKAAALLSTGVPAVALPGIWNGAPKDAETGRPALLADLAGAALKGRQCWVLFDCPAGSGSSVLQSAEQKAARRLGGLLARAGAAEVLVGTVPGTHGKGADDHLAAGGAWEQLAAALQPLKPEAVVPWLRRADRIAPAGRWLGVACPIPSPEEARLVALRAAMGAGKTEAIAAAVAPLLLEGTRVVLITHRRSLGAALAERLGLPWGDDAAPGSDLRQTGIALCLDSLHPASGLRFRAADWTGAVVVMDECSAVLAHGLMATGTAIAKHRTQVLSTLGELLATAEQVITADAQLNAAVLEALETATGTRALLIGSEHQPAAGRQLVSHPSASSWRLALVDHLRHRRRAWIATTAQQAGAPNSAQNLAALAAEEWPSCRTLVVDSQTVADPAHPASQLANDPNGIAAQFDLVIATPAVAAGLSVDKVPGHFAAVFAMAGGTTDPAGVAQALARVRDGCIRHLYAPERSPGSALRVGSGAPSPKGVLQQLANHEAAAIAQLLAAGGTLETGHTGPWLTCWGRLAANQNAARLAYRETVLSLLELEGYAIELADQLAPEQEVAAGRIGKQLKTIAAASQAAEDQAVIAADLITASEAAQLAKARRLSPADRAKLQRYRIAMAWGLGETAPTPELLEADRSGLHRRLRFRWMLSCADARELVARADLVGAKAIGGDSGAWAPDLCRQMEGPKLAAADAMGLPRWIERAERDEWFAADDPGLLELHAIATSHAGSMAQVLGISPGIRPTTTLRQVLGLVGLRLVTKRQRTGRGRKAAASYLYRIEREPLPPLTSAPQLEAAWRTALVAQAAGGCVPKNPLHK